ncbi:Drug/metabolite transporter [Quillaja saponaria]|uniref:Drug/metabolite transporter n=1 Tax=Quillaja saponaria TaxID=32244 RepID=A0AAD7Q5K6_QUISA|nr:Drug/metabolite transporter [Quillaja saponaria]
MASPCPTSTTVWNTTIRSDSASTISCSFNKQSMFLITTSLFDGSSSSCYSGFCSHPTTSRSFTYKKIIHNSRGNKSYFSIEESNPLQKKKNKALKQNHGVKVGSELVTRKRLFWQKVLSASSKIRSIVLLNMITIVYASDTSVIKGVEAIMDPAAFSAVRFTVSAIPFLPFVFQARDDIQIRNAGVELGLWISLGYLSEALGLLTSDAGRASFISLFTVIAVPLLDGMLGAIIPSRTWFGVLMSAIGVAMLECSGSPPSVGDLLNFLSAIFFGIHMLRTEHISRSTKKENFLPLLGYEVSVVALLSTIWAFIGKRFDGNQSVWTWMELWDWMVAFPWIPALYTGVFSTGLCLWIEMEAMRNVSATQTALIYGLEPLWGAGFAWFLLGERWGTIGWIGAALVLGGSLMVQMFGSSEPNRFEAEEHSQKGDILLLPNKQKMQNGLSKSPVVVKIKSRKDVMS